MADTTRDAALSALSMCRNPGVEAQVWASVYVGDQIGRLVEQREPVDAEVQDEYPRYPASIRAIEEWLASFSPVVQEWLRSFPDDVFGHPLLAAEVEHAVPVSPPGLTVALRAHIVGRVRQRISRGEYGRAGN